MDDIAVYGYVSSTRIKFILILQLKPGALVIKDQEVKSVLERIHLVFIEWQLNPFYEECKPMKSKSLLKKLNQIINPISH